MEQHWDTIVIGSGSGGLTAAVALTRAGQKVLVLEQHYLPGGWCQSFPLGGYHFSPGVHYISECGPGGTFRRLYEGLGLSNDIEFCELNPDGYDHLVVAGEQMDVPTGYDLFVNRLIQKFPHEKEGILKFMGVINNLNEDISKVERMLSFPKILKVPFVAPTLTRWAFSTLQPLLDAHIKDARLRDFLIAQTGNNGLSATRVSLPFHAGMTMSYMRGGAYYPRGGARSIPKALIRGLKRGKSQIKVRTRVKQILLKGSKAIGVELENGEKIYANHIISNADPAITFSKLIPSGPGNRERKKAQRTEYSVGLFSVFCAVDLDLKKMGYDSGNFWWYRNGDVNGLYEQLETLVPQKSVDGLFLTITSLKDPKPGKHHHTIEMFTFVRHSAFKKWESTQQGERGADYEAFKESIGNLMIAAADEIIPGLSKALTFKSVATPLSNDFYCETFQGAPYGCAKTPWQVGPFSFSVETSIDGLYQCGASTISQGVAGAAFSGMMAAQKILGARELDDLLGPADGSLRVYPADRPEEWLAAVAPATAEAEVVA